MTWLTFPLAVMFIYFMYYDKRSTGSFSMSEYLAVYPRSLSKDIYKPLLSVYSLGLANIVTLYQPMTGVWGWDYLQIDQWQHGECSGNLFDNRFMIYVWELLAQKKKLPEIYLKFRIIIGVLVYLDINSCIRTD